MQLAHILISPQCHVHLATLHRGLREHEERLGAVHVERSGAHERRRKRTVPVSSLRLPELKQHCRT